MAKLKIFISSTCYDLRMVRSELRPFLIDMGHDPVMSDNNDVLYDPATHTHLSCMNEIANSDVVLLIIGSRFGGSCVPSAIKDINSDILKPISSNTNILEKLDNISITQAEVLKAIENQIPIYTYILDNVFHDHHLYEKNKHKPSVIKEIDFPSIQQKNSAEYIFEFINFIRLRKTNNNISTFSKPIDIKNDLKKQLSHLMQHLLSERKLGRAINEPSNDSAFANIQIVEGTEGYLNLLANLIETSEREVLFTSTRMAGTNEGGVYGKLQKLIINSSIQFQKNNPNRLHYGIIDAGSAETSSGAAELRSKVPDIVLRFHEELNSIKVNFFISDENQVVLRLNKGGNDNRYSVLIQNTHLARILKKYFYSLWEKSKFMSLHIKNVVEHNEHTLEEILDSSGHEKATELIEFLDLLNEIDRKHLIIPSRFLEKVIHAKRPHFSANSTSAFKKYKEYFLGSIGCNDISHIGINEIKTRVVEGSSIDYGKLSKTFFVKYFLANYFKARHSLRCVIEEINTNNSINILDVGGGGGASSLAIVDFANHEGIEISRLDIVDQSKDQIDITKSIIDTNNTDIQYHLKTALNYLSSSDRKYDLIYAGNILCEANDKNEVFKTLEILKQALNTNGKLLVVERTESEVYEIAQKSPMVHTVSYMYQNERYMIPIENTFFEFIDTTTTSNLSEFVKKEYTLRYALYE